jgi:DNA-directed RNA polymerase specialized sigma24 family protein
MRFEDISQDEWCHVELALKRYFIGKVRDPEDHAQETLKRVVEKLTGNDVDLQGENAFGKYCFGFARNILKEDRGGRSHQQLPPEVAAAEHKIHGMNSLETVARVQQALARLPAEDRKLLEESEMLSLDELALIYQRPKVTMAVLIFRAKKRLKELLS